MAFEETGSEQEYNDSGGLPKRWDALDGDCCPKCLDPLVYFEHIELWKCTCGFKISNKRKREIVKIMRSGTFGYGNYDDESPFGSQKDPYFIDEY